jgi:hypothetical protein
MIKYYQPSGKFSTASFIYFILSAVIAFPILALVYTYLVWYIPFIYINFFITAGFGFGVALVISYLSIKIGKVRSPKLALIFGVLGGLIALYFSWAIWVDLVINAGESYGNSRIGITTSNIKFVQVFQLAIHPEILYELASKINEVGTWGMRGTTVSGVFLTIIWVIEMLIVVVISLLLPYASSKIPFCELGNKWFDEKVLPAFNPISNQQEMISNLEKSNQNSFDELQYASNLESQSHSIFTLYSSNQGENFLSIENKIASTNKKGEIEFKDDEFVEYIAVSSDLKRKLLNR